MAATKTQLAAVDLEGGLTVLRPITRTDLPRLSQWDEDPEIIALMGRRFSDGRPGPDEWFRRVLTDRGCRVLAIETRDGRELIGEVELDRIDWRQGSAELRICIGDRSFWGRGYGPDALTVLLRTAFRHWNLKVVYLRVYQANQRAVRLYQRLGFTRRGVLAPCWRRGDTSAVLLMSLPRERYLRLHDPERAAGVSP